MRPRPSLLLALALLVHPREGHADPVLAEAVVAVVETRAILFTELELETTIWRARQAGPGVLALESTDGELAAGLDRLIDQIVVYAEAERLQVFELQSGDVQRGVAELKAALGPALDAWLLRHEVEEQSLRDVVRRDLRVARYLEGRFRLASRPKEPAVADWARLHAADLPGNPAEAIAAARTELGRQRFDALTRTFVADVRRRAHVRLLRDFSASGTTTATRGVAIAPEATRRGQP